MKFKTIAPLSAAVITAVIIASAAKTSANDYPNPSQIHPQGIGKCDGTKGCNSESGCRYTSGFEARIYHETTLCRLCDEPGSAQCNHLSDWFVCYEWTAFAAYPCDGILFSGTLYKDGACAGFHQ